MTSYLQFSVKTEDSYVRKNCIQLFIVLLLLEIIECTYLILFYLILNSKITFMVQGYVRRRHLTMCTILIILFSFFPAGVESVKVYSC